MNKLVYTTPVVEMTTWNSTDVITTSGLELNASAGAIGLDGSSATKTVIFDTLDDEN